MIARLVCLLLVACGGDAEPECRNDYDCRPGSLCVANKCSTGGLDAACSSDLHCSTGRCVQQRCTAGELGARCTSDGQCPVGQNCVMARCTTGSIGAMCGGWGRSDCKGTGEHCFRGSCRLLGRSGEACDLDGDCAEHTCLEDKCLSSEELRARTERLAIEQRDRELAEEKAMLAASGVTPEPTRVEKSETPPGPGQRVRVVTVKRRGKAFAACRTTERLVGGGCHPESAAYPSEFGTEDTVGARWNCERDDDEVTAYALCQKL